MPIKLDTRLIRRSTPAQLHIYYKQLISELDDNDITSQLLQAVEQGSIPPLTFSPWLGTSKSPGTIRVALEQNKSVVIRKLACKHLRKRLCSPRWKEFWDGVGGTAGVLDIFSELSVLEIKEACNAIGRCGKGNDLEEKRACFTELFKGLHPSQFPDAPYKTNDQRPLARYYGHIIPACSTNVIAQAMEDGLKGVWHHVRERDLLIYHPEIMRREQLRSLTSNQTSTVNLTLLGGLIKQHPSTNTTQTGFSSSMEFALTVLRQLVNRKTPILEDYFFINDLVRPLLGRAFKKRLKWETILEIVDLTMQYLVTNPTVGKEITTTEGDVLHLIAAFWSHQPDLFEKHLRKLCSYSSLGTSKLDKPSDWDDFLSGTLPSRRYQLLRLCFQESTGLDLDVDAHLAKVKGPLRQTLLTKIGNKSALSLLTRLRKMRGDEGLVETSSSYTILDIPSNFQGNHGDPDLFHIHLHNLNGFHEQAELLATKYLDSRKKKAVSASQPEQRSFYAKSALYIAIACGSLAKVEETFRWTERFMRDPMVIRELYPRWFPDELKRLLSGVPALLDSSLTIPILRNRVEHGNRILVNMFNTACAALREPSFLARDWHGVLNCFFNVVKERIDTTPMLKKVLNVSDQDLYDSFWEPTIPVLMEIEGKANQDGYERLDATSMRGILDCVSPSQKSLTTTDMSTYTFIDNLARARNGLWRKLRPVAYPGAASLPTPFPGGLPIQLLTAPWTLDIQDLESFAPYLASRVQATLFPDPSAALRVTPEDSDSEKAIGFFVDSYQYALELHLPRSCDKAEASERAVQTWMFAVGPLSQGRMTEKEAVRYWRNRRPARLFNIWPPKESAEDSNETWPLIPESRDHPNEPEEWNPFTSGRPNTPESDVEKVTYIDLSLVVLDQTPYSPRIYHKLEKLLPKIPGCEVHENTIWWAERNIGEGGVLAALLYLDTKFRSNNPRILETPYPSSNDPRYPSLYLDDEFLSSEYPNPFNAIRGIRGHLDTTPPPLLAQLAQSVIDTLDATDPESSNFTTLHEIAMMLIVRLEEGDRPALATDLVLSTIITRPKSSSWHRQLLKSTFLRRLAASDAQACFDSFAKRIMASLDRVQLHREDLKSRAEHEEESPEVQSGQVVPQNGSHIKITTIKMLAQLLQGSEFIGEDYALVVLSSLSQKSSHIDVRLNILKSLLEVLKFGLAGNLENILTTLERIVPLAGSLNEREPMSENSWTQSEETLALPELQSGFTGDMDTFSPLLGTLVSHYRNSPCEGQQFPPFIKRILLPTIKCLELETSRWVALFLRKYGNSDTALGGICLPDLPRDSNIHRLILRAEGMRVLYIPRSLLDKYIGYIAFNMAPPEPIKALNDKLRKDPKLRSQPDVQTWLHLYGQGIDALKTFEPASFLSLLATETKLTEETGITPRSVHEQFIKLFTVAVWNDEVSYQNLSNVLVRYLSSGECLIKPWWKTHGQSIVKAMVAYINTLRTNHLECDPIRKPSVLPDTFSWRLLLLDYPWPNENSLTDRDRLCKVFADQIAVLIDEISTGIYHNKLAQLKAYLSLNPVSSTDDRSVSRRIGGWTVFSNKRDPQHDSLMWNRLLTAIYLGGISKTRPRPMTTPEILRVEVAAYLVEQAGPLNDLDKEAVLRLKKTVDSWKLCESEDVRRMGYVLGGTFGTQ